METLKDKVFGKSKQPTESVQSTLSTNAGSLEDIKVENCVKSLQKVDNIKTRYKLKKKMASGSYGKVYRATSKLHGFQCAIKVLPKYNEKDPT